MGRMFLSVVSLSFPLSSDLCPRFCSYDCFPPFGSTVVVQQINCNNSRYFFRYLFSFYFFFHSSLLFFPPLPPSLIRLFHSHSHSFHSFPHLIDTFLLFAHSKNPKEH